MKFITKYYDRLLLVVLLLFFLGLLIFQIFSVLGERNKRPEEKLNLNEPVSDYRHPDFKTSYVLLEKLRKGPGKLEYRDSLLVPPELKKCPMSTGSYVHFIPKTVRENSECPFCGKRIERGGQGITVIGGTDSDGDGIPDSDENTFGLNPKDKSDGSMDKDEDGFTNREEYMARTDLSDPKSRPSYGGKLYVTKIVRLPLGMKLLQYANAAENKDTREWEIQIEANVRVRNRRNYRRKTVFLKLGESLVLDPGIRRAPETRVEYVMESIEPDFQENEATGSMDNLSKLTLVRKGRKEKITGIPGKEIVDPRQKVIFMLDVPFEHSNDISAYVGESFTIGDEKRGFDTFTLISLDVEKQTARLREKNSGRIIEVPSVRNRKNRSDDYAGRDNAAGF